MRKKLIQPAPLTTPQQQVPRGFVNVNTFQQGIENPRSLNNSFHSSNPHSPIRIPQDKHQGQNMYQNSSPTSVMSNNMDPFMLDRTQSASPDPFFLQERMRSYTQPHPQQHRILETNNQPYYGT